MKKHCILLISLLLFVFSCSNNDTHYKVVFTAGVASMMVDKIDLNCYEYNDKDELIKNYLIENVHLLNPSPPIHKSDAKTVKLKFKIEYTGKDLEPNHQTVVVNNVFYLEKGKTNIIELNPLLLDTTSFE